MLAARRGDKKQAEEYFQKAIDITPKMVSQLIHLLKHENIKYVVAPYEADAQLVYLEKNSFISGIISEDSDLLVFGARVLLTKMNQFGECVRVQRVEFPRCTELFLSDLTDAQLRAIAIFSGCDYSDGIPKVGIKIAHRFVRKFLTGERALRGIRYEGYNVPQGFEQVYQQAELTFLHQRVYSLEERRLVMLSEPKDELEEDALEYIGRDMDPALAQAIATGKVDPLTKEEFKLSEKAKAVVENPVLKTLSFNSQGITPRQQNQKITEYFKRASHANSAPSLPAVRMSSNGISFKQDRATSSSKMSGTSLIAKRIERVFEKNINVDSGIATKAEDRNAKEKKDQFVSKFFSSMRKRPSTAKVLEPTPRDFSDESGFESSDFDPDDGFPDLIMNNNFDTDEADKENSLDIVANTQTRKRKLSGSPFRQRANPSLPSSSPNSTGECALTATKKQLVFDLKKFAYKPGAANNFSPDVAASFFGNSSSDEEEEEEKDLPVPTLVENPKLQQQNNEKERGKRLSREEQLSLAATVFTMTSIPDLADYAPQVNSAATHQGANVSEKLSAVVKTATLSGGFQSRLDRFRYTGRR
jgi:5'-3' exonuclease